MSGFTHYRRDEKPFALHDELRELKQQNALLEARVRRLVAELARYRAKFEAPVRKCAND